MVTVYIQKQSSWYNISTTNTITLLKSIQKLIPSLRACLHAGLRCEAGWFWCERKVAQAGIIRATT
jgi:hypothetical protein